jgi:hypothetical protein
MYTKKFVLHVVRKILHNLQYVQKQQKATLVLWLSGGAFSFYRSGSTLRSKRAATISTTSCTPSRAAASTSGTGPSRTGAKEMAGLWLRKQVKTWSTTIRASSPTLASRRAIRVDSRHYRRSAAESSAGRTAPIEEGASATWMGLSPRRHLLHRPTSQSTGPWHAALLGAPLPQPPGA